MAMKRSRILLTVLAFVLFPGSSFGSLEAQIPDSIRADTARTPFFRLRGLTILVPRPVSTTGGASAVEIVLDSMFMQAAPTLEQVLRRMPLIQIRRNSRGEAQPALRGGEDRQIAVIMDGVPITLGWDARTDLSIIPLASAQRINLIRGLSSVLYGPNVLAGVVEVDIARGAERQTAPRPWQLDMGLDHTGALNIGVAAGKFLETPGGSWVLRAGGGHQGRDGFVLSGKTEEEADLDPTLLTDDGDLRLNTDATRYDGFLSARYRSEAGTWLSLSSSGFWEERGVAPEAHVDDPRLWRYPEQTRLITAFSSGTGQRSTSWGEGDLEVSVGLDIGTTDIDQFETAAYEEIAGEESSDDLTLTVRLMGDHSLGDQGELRGAFTYADINHDEVLDRVEENSYRQRLWSLGTEVEWGLGGKIGFLGSKGTRFTAGLSIDGADTPKSGDKPPLGSLTDWGGRFGFTTLAGFDALMIHGSLSRRTRFPALRELYSGALGRFIPNPELEPEELAGGELGFTLTESWLELQAVGFYQSLTNGIVRSSVSTPEGNKYKRMNQDRIRSFGLELLASGQVGRLGWAGDVTLQQARGIEPDGAEVELEYEPGIAGKLSAFLPMPLELNASATGRFMGEQYCENPQLGGLQSFSSSQLLDLSLGRLFGLGGRGGGRAQATLSLDNVTDSVILDQCGLPQPGRTFRLQVRVW